MFHLEAFTPCHAPTGDSASMQPANKVSLEPRYLHQNGSCTRYVCNRPIAQTENDTCLVFVPGWAGSLEIWQHQISHFQDQYSVLAMDYPGFGQSYLACTENGEATSPSKVSLLECARLVNAVLKQEDITSCIVVGHSIGGALALSAAVENPTAIKAVIGADSFTYMNLYPAVAAEHVGGYTQSLKDDFKAGVSALLDSYFLKDSDPKTVEWVFNTMCAVDHKTGIMILEDFLTWSLDQELSQYKGPVLAFVAPDTFDEEAFAPIYAKRISTTRIPDAGHFVMLDKPQAFNALLESKLIELG